MSWLYTALLKRAKSFIPAWQGIRVLWGEFNIRLHLFFGLCACLAGFWLEIGLQQWLWVGSAIAAVLICEGFNSALESLVDLASPKFDPLAGKAKDIAAGVVLLAAMYAVFVALLVFLPALKLKFYVR